MKKNILLVSNYASDTAYAWWLMEHFWCLLNDLVCKEGGTVFLAYPCITTLSRKITSSSIKVVELSVNKPSKELARFLKQNNIKIIYFTDRNYFSFFYMFLRSLGVRKIIIHDHTPGDRPRVTGIKRFVKVVRNKISFLTADAVLNVSEFIRRRSIENGCVPISKTYTVQNGITPLILSSNIRQKYRNDLMVDNHTKLIISVGRAHPYKRFDFVIQVARLLLERHPEIKAKFIIVGDGPHLDELKEMVSEDELLSHVKLLGYRDDVQQLIQAGDIAFHAALGEAFSLAIIEYMSAGMPVFVPDIPSVCQAVDHMETGCIYKWNDAGDAADMLAKLISNVPLLKKMGSAARVKVSKCYNLTECSKQFVATVGQIISSL